MSAAPGEPGSRRAALRAAVVKLVARLSGESGQAVVVLMAGGVVAMAGAALFAQYGGALLARGHDQRVADLAAVAAAKKMSSDFSRLFEPPVLPDGAPNPRYLSPAQYRLRARAASVVIAARNHAVGRISRVSFGISPTPTSVTVATTRKHEVSVAGSGDRRDVEVRARATAELRFAIAALPVPAPTNGSGGGYDGPLAYRQGKPMRPDVAAAFDRMAAAAHAAGYSLSINSAYRSDAEQARLFAQHPDPKWVAPPGTSLHRYGTELDLGPPSAYGWLAANARRFGFIQRYACGVRSFAQGAQSQ